MFEAGLVTFISFFLLAMKIPPRILLRLLGRPLMLDISVTVFLFWLYGNTVSGLMAATFSALVFSATITLARQAVGYVANNKYQVGYFYRPDLKTLFTDKELEGLRENN